MQKQSLKIFQNLKSPLLPALSVDCPWVIFYPVFQAERRRRWLSAWSRGDSYRRVIQQGTCAVSGELPLSLYIIIVWNKQNINNLHTLTSAEGEKGADKTNTLTLIEGSIYHQPGPPLSPLTQTYSHLTLKLTSKVDIKLFHRSHILQDDFLRSSVRLLS